MTEAAENEDLVIELIKTPHAPPTEGDFDEDKTKEKEVHEVEKEEPEVRETWGSKVSYLLTLIGYAVGFGNIWRFPYLLHSNGGIAFLIPYIIMLSLEGIPLFFMELAIGQRLRKGALGSWNEISPYLGGLGIASALACYFCVIYYNVLLSWVMSYFIDSFRTDVPWRSCEHQFESVNKRFILKPNEKTNTDFGNKTIIECFISKQPSKYYWYRQVLDISNRIEERGNWNGYIFLYLTISWILICLILIKGIKSSEKVVYFTALFPYVTLIIFFIANFTFDGWEYGYIYLFKPDFSVLKDPQVWLTAGTQIFFSLGVAYGCLIVFASYLPPNNNCYKDAVWVSIINCSTSIFAAIVIFPVLGSQGYRNFNECIFFRKVDLLKFIGKITSADYTGGIKGLENKANQYSVNGNAAEKGIIRSYILLNNTYNDFTPFMPPLECDLEKEVRDSGSGTGLVFIAFAEAAKNLPVPQIWCALFFFMLFTLGVDSSFGTTEGAMSALIDMKVVKWPRWVITCLMCGSLWLISIVFSFGWGQYVQVFLDQFVANWSLLIIAFFELVGISWIYGLAKFAYDIKLMTGHSPNIYMLFCWKYLSPSLLFLILIMSMVDQFKRGYFYERYDKNTGTTVKESYSIELIAVGYVLLLTIVFWVPLQAILKLFGLSVLKKEIASFFPEEELRQERNMTDQNDIGESEYGKLDSLVMGQSLQDLKAFRKSNTSIHSLGLDKKSNKSSVTSVNKLANV